MGGGEAMLKVVLKPKRCLSSCSRMGRRLGGDVSGCGAPVPYSYNTDNPARALQSLHSCDTRKYISLALPRPPKISDHALPLVYA